MFEADRDVPDTEWAAYMSRYERWYCVFTDEDRVKYVRCRKGKLGLNGLKSKTLFFTTQILSPAEKSRFWGKISRNLQGFFTLRQLGDFEFTIVFKEAELDRFVPFIKPIKRPKLSDAERLARAARLFKVRGVSAGGVNVLLKQSGVERRQEMEVSAEKEGTKRGVAGGL